jgi:2-deoxy-D-gluconate 3-dehydrogenase
MTKNVALELAAHNIQVNTIAPGGITTHGTASGDNAEELKKITEYFSATLPMKRMGEPDEIGKAVLFRASGLSSYMTGSQVVVDGGALLR